MFSNSIKIRLEAVAHTVYTPPIETNTKLPHIIPYERDTSLNSAVKRKYDHRVKT